MNKTRFDKNGEMLRIGECVRQSDDKYMFKRTVKGDLTILYGSTLAELREKEDRLLLSDYQKQQKNKYEVFNIEIICDVASNYICDYKHAGAFCYFIADCRYVKIGKAKNVKKRLSSLQNANGDTLQLICTIPCETEAIASGLEKEMHSLFSDYRVKGEWFDILYRINTLALREKFGANLECLIK